MVVDWWRVMFPIGIHNQIDPAVVFVSHSWDTSPGAGVNLTQRLGYRFTVGGSSLTCNQLSQFSPLGANNMTENVRVHRVSDGALMSEANISQVTDTWISANVPEFVLAASTQYVISHRRRGLGRSVYRNPFNQSFYAGITYDTGIIGTTDDLPTTTSANDYLQSRFGYAEPSGISPYTSHTFSGGEENFINNRLGYRFTVGASAITLNRLYLWLDRDDRVERVMIHRWSDDVIMADAKVVSITDTWASTAIGDVTLAASTDYVISTRFDNSVRGCVRNPSTLNFDPQITLVDYRFSSDDNKPTSVTANAYVLTKFGYE